MPKSRKRRSFRPFWRRRRVRRFRFTYVNVGVALVMIGILLVWWLTTRPGGIFNSTKTYTVQGPPTISAEFINKVLSYYHSPAANTGQALYDDGVKYGIDPVYALAFFMHESSFGTTGVATTTHSLGNIRATAGYQQYDGYRLYPSWEAGFADWYALIADQYIAQWKLNTVDQIVPVYAPSSENDVSAYIQAVKNAVDTWRNGIVVV